LGFGHAEEKFYVTEKNDLGIIWNVFYTWEEAVNIKTEHDSYQWRRESVRLFTEKELGEGQQ
jgi:hypothetical protein